MTSVFVSEYLCSGAVESPHQYGSLFEEGRAMLFALLEDFSRSGQFDVLTTCEPSLQDAMETLSAKVQVIPVNHPKEELTVFSRLAREADFTIVIAPETNGILLSRRDLVDEVGGRFAGCSREAIAICGDKWNTYLRLREAGIPHIPTRQLSSLGDIRGLSYPQVLKPRDGAGSCNTFLVRHSEELQQILCNLPRDDTNFLVQPFVEGMSYSCAAIFNNGVVDEILPTVKHQMSYDPTISCRGLTIDPFWQHSDASFRIVEKTAMTISGLNGYVGFDFILPKLEDNIPGIFKIPGIWNLSSPILVEINPRLTTSYLEYRRKTSDHLAERLILCQ